MYVHKPCGQSHRVAGSGSVKVKTLFKSWINAQSFAFAFAAV